MSKNDQTTGKKFDKSKVIKLLNSNSFKRKKIILQLFGYSFSHKPIQKFDKGFFGREDLIKRIRSFINDSSSASGAYLISGFRGMGKTSLVNKALETFEEKNHFKSFYFLFFISIITLFFDAWPFQNSTPLAFLSFGIWMLLVLYLFYSHPKVPLPRKKLFSLKRFWENAKLPIALLVKNPFDTHKYAFHNLLYYIVAGWAWGILLLLVHRLLHYYFGLNLTSHDKFWINIYLIAIYYSFIYIAHPRKELAKADRYPTSIQWMLIMLSLTLMVSIAYQLKSFAHPNIHLSFILFLLWLWFSISVMSFIRTPQFELQSKAYSSLKSLFSFNKVLTVRVNLGKDLLSDIDVLKYTTNNLLQEYKRWRNDYTNVVSIGKAALPYFLLFWFFIYIGGLQPFDSFNDNVIEEFNLTTYFPSQAMLLMDGNDSKIRKKFNTLLEKGTVRGAENYIEKMNEIIHKYNDRHSNSSIDTIPLTEVRHKSNFYQRVVYSLNALDYYLAVVYHYIRKTILGDANTGFWLKYYPLSIDYSVIALLFFIWLFFAQIDLPGRLGFSTHKSIIRDLQLLRERIDASLIVDKGINIPTPGRGPAKIPILYKSKKYSYLPLDAKDIEVELMRILEKIHRIPTMFVSVLPIIVYDELDKITPHFNYSLHLKEEERSKDSENYKTRRQENIIGILSSLKAYLSSSPAKFIFIAGRDMYDAALAGISDRQSILESIFHDNKIYVPSFYSEKSDWAINDITSMTENFVCQYLMPEEKNADKEFRSLEMYAQYLSERGMSFQDQKKIIWALSNLITYISYRSNGAPKKIVSLFEEFVVSGSEELLYNKEEGRLSLTSSVKSLYLVLPYYDQYRFAFISYLVTPIFFKLGSYIKEFSDKILVSMSYLVDHIFKFHNQAFSTHNLALTPEIIDIAKEPEFRPFLFEILNDISISHLRKIISGLYEYRFQSKIYLELRFLTMLNPQEAAAFNFTLDESLESKRYFYRRLLNLKEQYSGYITKDPENKMIDSISFYHMVLADLHFYDQEYSDAIINYSEAIQFLKLIPFQKLNYYQFILLIKNMLKLGLSYEKDGAFKDAKLLYFELSSLVIKKRELYLSCLGLDRFLIHENNLDELISKNKEQLIKVFGTDEKEKIKQKLFGNGRVQEAIIIGRRKAQTTPLVFAEDLCQGSPSDHKPSSVYPFSEMDTFYDFEGDYIAQHTQDLPLLVDPVFLNFKISLFEHLRLLYQPIIARLHLIEKTSLNGVRALDIQRALAEFSFLNKITNNPKNNILVSEFYNKLGDLLYYKNASLMLKSSSELNGPIDALFFYLWGLSNLLGALSNEECSKDGKACSLPHNMEYNEDSVREVVEENNFRSLMNCIKELNIEKIQENRDANYMAALANAIIDTADALLSSNILDKNTPDTEKHRKVPTDIISLYKKASDFFEKMGEFRLAKSQRVKILMLYILNGSESDNEQAFLEHSEKCIELIFKTFKMITLPEKWKYEEIFSAQSNTEKLDNKDIFYLSCLQDEIKEVQVLEHIFQINKVKKTLKDVEGESFKALKAAYLTFKKLEATYSFLNDSPSIAHRYTRVLENNLRVKLNKLIYECLEKGNFSKYEKQIRQIVLTPDLAKEDNYSTEDLKLFLIIDSIGALTESMKVHDLLGVNYVSTGYLTNAKEFKKMHYWSEKLKWFRENSELEKKDVHSLLIHTLGTYKLRFLDPDYNLERAIFFNDKLTEIHNQGIAYQHFIKSKFYLDDDFNDNIVHFGFAKERFQIRQKNFKKEVEKIKKNSQYFKLP